MRALIQETIHYPNSLPEGTPPDLEKVREFEERYRAILKKAKEEYEYIPESRLQTMNRSVRLDNISASNSRLCHSGDSSPSSISVNA